MTLIRRFCLCLWVVFLSACASTDSGITPVHSHIYDADEHDIRMAVYLERTKPVAVDKAIHFLDEDESFIEELKKASGVALIRPISLSRYDTRKRRIVDRRTGETGFRLGIPGVKITGDLAVVSVSYYASPLGASQWLVSLRKEDGRWVITEWKMMGVS
jgi:hypothetical protein